MYNNYYNKNCCVEVELNTPEIEIDLEMGAKGPQGVQGPQGNQGPKGDKGDTGDDGFSPTVTSSKSGKTTTLTITDVNGTSTATILDGEDGPTYTAGSGIDITNNVISNTQTSAQWGNITGTLSDQTDLQTALNAKANTSSVPTKVSQLTNDSGYTTFSGSYNDLTNKPTIPVVPTNISSFTNDSNYQNATQVQTAINNAIGTALNGSY